MLAFGVMKMSPNVFWSMTLNEFGLAVKGHNMSEESLLASNWQLSYMNTIGHHNPKKFPKLKDLLNAGKEVNREERAETRKVMEALTADNNKRKNR